ncbi:hypothetical protein LXA43DRAFT_330165 [Ganoderma leucocontextum]|nr:hypothetical protein LXA43DRAFT_330165 [Ganoderma leucocontextum]
MPLPIVVATRRLRDVCNAGTRSNVQRLVTPGPGPAGSFWNGQKYLAAQTVLFLSTFDASPLGLRVATEENPSPVYQSSLRSLSPTFRVSPGTCARFLPRFHPASARFSPPISVLYWEYVSCEPSASPVPPTPAVKSDRSLSYSPPTARTSPVVKSSVEPGSQLESYESKSVEHAPGHCVRRRIRTHWRRRVTIKTRRRCLRNAYSTASRRTSESTNTAGGRGEVGIQSGWTTSTEHSPALYIPISPYARTTALTRMASQKHPHPWCVHILSPNSSISAPASL